MLYVVKKLRAHFISKIVRKLFQVNTSRLTKAMPTVRKAVTGTIQQIMKTEKNYSGV